MTAIYPSLDTRATLLLCAPLGERPAAAGPLEAREFYRLLDWLAE